MTASTTSRRALIAGLAIVCPTLAFGAPQSPPSAPVTVLNTTKNPVPVTGSLGVTGNVAITNSVTNPVPVSVETAATNPSVTLKATIGFGGGCCSSGSAVKLDGSAFTVPAGNRFAVEYVSADMSLPTGQKGVHFGLANTSPSVIVVRVPFLLAGTFASATEPNLYVGGQVVRAYFDAGSSVEAFCFRDSQPGSPACQVSIVGHLETLP